MPTTYLELILLQDFVLFLDDLVELFDGLVQLFTRCAIDHVSSVCVNACCRSEGRIGTMVLLSVVGWGRVEKRGRVLSNRVQTRVYVEGVSGGVGK